MKRLYIRKSHMNEIKTEAQSTETNNNQNAEVVQDANNASNEKVAQIQKQMASIIDQKTNLKRDYSMKINALDAQFAALDKQVADLGAKPSNIAMTDSVHYKTSFSKRLYESVTENKTVALADIIYNVCNDMDTLSYTFTEKRCHTFAKRIIGFINKEAKEGMLTPGELEEFIRDMLFNGNSSLSSKEAQSIASETTTQMSANTLFKWIFDKN